MKKNIFDFYLCKIKSEVATLHLSKHSQFLVNFNLKFAVFDFCGKLKQYGKYFSNLGDCFIIEDDWENDISDILDKYDLVYFFEDIENINDNIFYKEFGKDKHFIFIVFSKGNFQYLEKNNLFYLR
ncbi:uncharacterized protein VNE69_01243 [Vairimorpha necatrix]|uniref:Uncharacterized protein n=1 Tax=Vairimorpha necatrix TaxID=6039 RepID=A0AAX4J8Q6_9MICR